MQIAAPQAVVQAILTNYPAWPELFPLEVLRIEQIGDRVLTELQINHGFLFGTRRLILENRLLPDGGVVSTLVDPGREHRELLFLSDRRVKVIPAVVLIGGRRAPPPGPAY